MNIVKTVLKPSETINLECFQFHFYKRSHMRETFILSSFYILLIVFQIQRLLIYTDYEFGTDINMSFCNNLICYVIRNI